MPETVYGRLAGANRLIFGAKALAEGVGLDRDTFNAAADAVARTELQEADSLLESIERNVSQPDVVGHVRDARQIIIALEEEWSK